MIDRRSFLTAGAALLPASWLTPARGAETLAGEPIIGTYAITLPRDGVYRVMADGIWAKDPTELSMFLTRGSDISMIAAAVRAPRPGEGGELVLATRIDAKAHDRISIEVSSDTNSMPRLAAMPLIFYA
jgi:hypothetical protein